MFGFFKKKKDEKMSKKINNLLMGAVIGGAIGSVIGASLKSKAEKEAREEEAFKHDKEESMKKGFLRRMFEKDAEDEDEIRRIPHE